MRTLPALWASCALGLATAAGLTACGSADSGSGSEALSAATPAPASDQPADLEVHIKTCHDGDTCTIDIVNGQTQRMTVRLIGIDAPEVSGGADNSGQPLGREAGTYLNDQVKGKTVRLKSFAQDIYHRTLGELYKGNSSVNLMMVKAGYAETFHLSSRLERDAFERAQTRAKGAHKGIWSLTDYKSPSDFRREDREREAQQH
jgi:endonuclease YncB( thermonuclease family)